MYMCHMYIYIYIYTVAKDRGPGQRLSSLQVLEKLSKARRGRPYVFFVVLCLPHRRRPCARRQARDGGRGRNQKFICGRGRNRGQESGASSQHLCSSVENYWIHQTRCGYSCSGYSSKGN